MLQANKYPYFPQIAVYMGSGASHSWLWFIEILDRMGFYAVHFVTEKNIATDVLGHMDVLLMSGGDTFALAEGLGPEGSERLRGFIEGGGLYIGTCAGAYLPLRSSMYPLSLFNYANVKISNISRRLPETEKQRLQKRFCSAYGCDLIYHPVREDVLIEMVNGYRASGKKEVVAPLYGGPSMLPSEDIYPIALYKDFTERTRFIVERELARTTLIGNIAVGVKAMGEGHLYIFGPHFEHPHYKSCNIFIRDIILRSLKKRVPTTKDDIFENDKCPVNGGDLKNLLRDLKRELSNSRIMASGMSDLSINWLIGNKYYEPEKISLFINTMWHRLRHLELMPNWKADRDQLSRCVEISKWVTKDIRAIRYQISDQDGSTRLASRLFSNLKVLTSSFLSIYFKAKRETFSDQKLGVNVA